MKTRRRKYPRIWLEELRRLKSTKSPEDRLQEAGRDVQEIKTRLELDVQEIKSRSGKVITRVSQKRTSGLQEVHHQSLGDVFSVARTDILQRR